MNIIDFLFKHIIKRGLPDCYYCYPNDTRSFVKHCCPLTSDCKYSGALFYSTCVHCRKTVVLDYNGRWMT